ncbi:MAG: hypothetical protein ACTSWY_01080 [Promethearchaeota archaeon]
MKLVRIVGITFLSISLPIAIILLTIMIIEEVILNYIVFAILILLYILLEILYDYILKIEFRTNWKLLLPYLILYYATCYGLIVMNWSGNIAFGIIILILCVIQLIFNILTHVKPKEKDFNK